MSIVAGFIFQALIGFKDIVDEENKDPNYVPKENSYAKIIYNKFRRNKVSKEVNSK